MVKILMIDLKIYVGFVLIVINSYQQLDLEVKNNIAPWCNRLAHHTLTVAVRVRVPWGLLKKNRLNILVPATVDAFQRDESPRTEVQKEFNHTTPDGCTNEVLCCNPPKKTGP